MKQLVLLYWGTVFLMYLSQTYYPVETQLDGPQTGKRHFMLRHADIFLIATIAWMTCFSFLRTSNNDSLLSSKIQINNCRQRHPGFERRFSTAFRSSVRSQQRKAVVLPLLFRYGLIRIFDASYPISQATAPYVLTTRNRPQGVLQISWAERS